MNGEEQTAFLTKIVHYYVFLFCVYDTTGFGCFDKTGLQDHIYFQYCVEDRSMVMTLSPLILTLCLLVGASGTRG